MCSARWAPHLVSWSLLGSFSLGITMPYVLPCSIYAIPHQTPDVADPHLVAQGFARIFFSVQTVTQHDMPKHVVMSQKGGGI